MKQSLFILLLLYAVSASAQIDPDLLRNPQADTSHLSMNLDAVYERPFIRMGKLPVAIGGYMEGNYQYLQEEGVTEGHQFQMRRVTLFLSSAIAQRMKFLTEIEFEEGTKEINIEFASLDFELAPLLNLRGGIVMNPIGAFNQNHDGPRWEFVDRPIAATQMLPATFSNAGFGIYGKQSRNHWGFAYELYLTNGFNESIIENTENRTFLPATKNDPNRFEESFNGSMLVTGKVAVKNNGIGEFGISYMRGAYNKFREDGIDLDQKRMLGVLALDANTRLPWGTSLTGEWAWVNVDVPETYSEQFGNRQQGGFLDIVHPVVKGNMLGYENARLNLAMRLEFVDWNRGKFKSTADPIGDHIYSVVPAISWRPTSETVFRINYRYQWQRDLLNNPPARLAGWQIGISTYF